MKIFFLNVEWIRKNALDEAKEKMEVEEMFLNMMRRTKGSQNIIKNLKEMSCGNKINNNNDNNNKYHQKP